MFIVVRPITAKIQERKLAHFDYPLTRASFCHGKLIFVKGLEFASFSLQSSPCKEKLGRINSD